ncbi:MAG: hypothetical protein Q9220_002962 [cf. Caloplaca sp. 1 TL-2023]
MRTSAIVSALLVGGALATPLHKYLEERALVVDVVTTTTVVWVTEGQPAPTPVVQPVAPKVDNKKAAVNQAYSPHVHQHAHAHPAAQPKVAQPVAPAPPPSSPAPAPVPVAENKAVQPPAPQTTTSTSPAPAPSPDTGSTSGATVTDHPTDFDTGSDTYKSVVLEHHNIHRANHSADALQWDDTMASYAQQVAQSCVYDHDRTPGGGGYGQNIAAGTPANQIAQVLTNGYYNDEMMLFPGYGNDNPDMSNFEKWGHFSQVLWQTTTHVGCYTATCSPPGKSLLDCNPATGQSYLKNTPCGNGGMGAVFTVCNYSPPGCHVMERESFSSPEIAQILNSNFIPIKVDREERPDVDAIYMNYVQATNGSGGWPLNVFVTPDLEPVFGGTYWPGPNHSMTAQGTLISQTVGFLEIIEKMRDVWITQELRCRESAKEITRQLKEFAEEGVLSRQLGEKDDDDPLDLDLLEEAYQHFAKKYDNINGGFSIAPKFPTPVNLQFLLRLGQSPQAVKDIVGEEECIKAAGMVIKTLRSMARGGIRDQIGFGFSRYSVTKDWSLPHFEKMLYDQAQLLDVYLDAFLITRDPEMLGAVYDIATYLTEPPMAAATGGFSSAEDADSYPTHSDNEKREGAYYVWTLKEFRTVLGEREGNVCARFYGVLADGNVARDNDPHDEFINQNVLKVTSTPAVLAKQVGLAEAEVVTILKEGRKKLRAYREKHRPRPALDDKVVVAWNGLAIGALARTGAVLEDIDPEKSKQCLRAAAEAADFIRREVFDEDTKVLYRIYRDGRGETKGFCDDYAFLIHGLIDLYEATFEEKYLEFADVLQKSQISLLHDPIHSAFHTTTPSPSLLLHLKAGMDAAEPSSNSVSASNLHRLASLLNSTEYSNLATSTTAAFEAEILQFPHCFAGMLGSVVCSRVGVKGVVLMDKGNAEVRRKIWEGVGVGRTVAWGGGEWLRGRNELVAAMKEGGEVMVCEGGFCREGVEFV